jgi:hypothetical protein
MNGVGRFLLKMMMNGLDFYDDDVFGRKEPSCLRPTEAVVLSAKKTKLPGFGPRANYTDQATAAFWRSSANFAQCWRD